MKSSTCFLTCILLLLSSFNALPIRQEWILREGRIILPQNDNDGLPLLPVRQELESKLLQSFGGFTHMDGVGGWESGNKTLNGTLSKMEIHHEPVWIYDVACLDNPQVVTELKEIALWVKATANQESICDFPVEQSSLFDM